MGLQSTAALSDGSKLHLFYDFDGFFGSVQFCFEKGMEIWTPLTYEEDIVGRNLVDNAGYRGGAYLGYYDPKLAQGDVHDGTRFQSIFYKEDGYQDYFDTPKSNFPWALNTPNAGLCLAYSNVQKGWIDYDCYSDLGIVCHEKGH